MESPKGPALFASSTDQHSTNGPQTLGHIGLYNTDRFQSLRITFLDRQVVWMLLVGL